MGEILRAILDQTCVDSNPAFYTGSISGVVTITASKTYVRKTSVLQCKSDTWFLMTGWSMDVGFLQAGGNLEWAPKTDATQFTLQDWQDSSQFSVDAVQYSLQNYNLNNFVTLPEYHLWKPRALIGFTMDIQLTSTAFATTRTNYVTLAGIEYRLPSGKGYE